MPEMLLERHAALDSWRKVGAELGISGGMAHRVAHGYDPKDPRIRSKLGMRSMAPIITLAGAIVEGGALVGVSSRTCAKRGCAVKFIPNVPIRKYCYLCSPTKGTKDGR